MKKKEFKDLVIRAKTDNDVAEGERIGGFGSTRKE